MRTAGLLLLGTLPTAAAAYMLLAGYLLNKVRPLPLTVFPDEEAALHAPVPPMYRRSRRAEAETPREPLGV